VLPPRQPLRRTSGLATAVVALLAAQIALIVAEVLAQFLQADQLRTLQATGLVTQQQLDRADGWVSGTSAIGGLAFLATVIVWCIWQHRAQANAVVLSGGGLRFTPGWAVGWWFIPIANLWKPFQTVRELCARGVEVLVPADGVASRRDDHRAVGLDLCRAAGATITTMETVVFDWLRKAGTDEFKKLSKLIR